MEGGYQNKILDRKSERLSTIERKSLIREKPSNTITNQIPVLLKFNKTLPNIK